MTYDRFWPFSLFRRWLVLCVGVRKAQGYPPTLGGAMAKRRNRWPICPNSRRHKDLGALEGCLNHV